MEEIVRKFGWDKHILKLITNKDLLYIAHGTLLNVMWQLGWEVIWGKMDIYIYIYIYLYISISLSIYLSIYICMAEFLCCSSETIITLLTGSTPLQN